MSGIGIEIEGININRSGSASTNPEMFGIEKTGIAGIPGIGSETAGIDTSKFGRFNGNEHTGSVNTGIAGSSGIGRLIPGIVIVRLGKAQLDMINRIKTFIGTWWYILFANKQSVFNLELPRKYDNTISVVEKGGFTRPTKPAELSLAYFS